jgi:hypothetical protein
VNCKKEKMPMNVGYLLDLRGRVAIVSAPDYLREWRD